MHPKFTLSCLPHLLLPGAPGTGGSSLFTLQQQSTKVWYLEAHAMKWLSILEYASYNCCFEAVFFTFWSILWAVYIYHHSKEISFKHDQIQNSITKVCFYCTADTLYWGCTETCQCTKTCHSGIHTIRSDILIKNEWFWSLSIALSIVFFAFVFTSQSG